MKKNKLLFTVATACAALGLLAGCGEENEVTVDKVTISGIQSAYPEGDTIAWDDLLVVVKYSDDSTISIADVEFDVETPTLSTTKALVKTSGLHDQETTQIGQYAISVSLKEDYSKWYNIGKIIVDNVTPDKYDLVSYTAPTFMRSYNEAMSDTNEETSFFKKSDYFTVGTRNKWRFNPVAIFMNKTNHARMSLTIYEKDINLVYLDDSGNATGPVEATRYVVSNDGIKLGENLIGKKLKISILPHGFETAMGGAAISPVEFKFQVADGVNIHNGKELGILNLTAYDAAYFYEPENHWDDHLGIDELGNIAENSLRKIFWNSEKKEYERRDQVKMWKDFLLNNAVVREVELEALQDAPAYFIVDDIDLMKEDIPSDYFITAEESSDGFATGCLRDYAKLYTILADRSKTINGNYLTLSAKNIPLCKSEGGNSGLKVYNKQTSTVAAGNSALFCFDGLVELNGDDVTTTDEWRLRASYGTKVHRCYMKNLNTVGNTGKSFDAAGNNNTDALMAVTGLIFTKTPTSYVDYDNMIVKEYMIGIFADGTLGQGNKKVPAADREGFAAVSQFDTIFLRDSKVFDCSNSGLFNYNCGGFHVSHTLMKRFGGGCIINAAPKAGEGKEMNVLKEAITKFDNDCVFENYVTGQEVYFAAMNAQTGVDLIKSFNEDFKSDRNYGKINAPFLVDGKMNLITLTMCDDGYMGSNSLTYYSTTTFNANTNNKFSISLTDETDANTLYTMIPSVAGQYAPVCTSELGDCFFINPGSGLLTVNPSDMSMLPYGMVPNGLNYCSYLSMYAPMPTGTTLTLTFKMPTRA